MFVKRKVSVKSAQSCTILKISMYIYIHTGKNSRKYTQLNLCKDRSSVCFPEFFPVCMHVENFRNGAGLYTFHADFSLKKNCSTS